MIKTAGANVSPREVEAAILEVSGLVSHVVGVDDEARGQVVAALVRRTEAPAAPSTSTTCGTRCGSASRRTRCPERIVVVPDGRGPDDVERQARPARAEGAAPVRPEAGDHPGPCWRCAARSTATSQAIVTADDASPTPSSTRPAPRRGGPARRRRGRQGGPGGAARAERDRVGRPRLCGVADRCRAGAPQHPAATRRSCWPSSRSRRCRTWSTIPAFRDRHYLDDLEVAAPGLLSAVRAGARHAAAPSLRTAVDDGRAARHGRRRRPWCRPSRPASGRPTTWSSSSPPAAAAPRRGSSTPTGRRCVPSPPGSRRAASARANGSTSRCRSSGPVGSARACSPRWWPAPRS